MAEVKTIVTHWTTICSNVDTGDGLFVPVSGYMNAADVDKIRCTFEVVAATDSSSVIQPGIQTANVEDAADTADLITGINSETGNGFNFAGAFCDVSGDTNGKQLVRLGFWFKTSAASLQSARVWARWQITKI